MRKKDVRKPKPFVNEKSEKARVKYLTESRDRGRVEYEQKAVRKLGSSASPSGRLEPPAKHYAASKVEK